MQNCYFKTGQNNALDCDIRNIFDTINLLI